MWRVLDWNYDWPNTMNSLVEKYQDAYREAWAKQLKQDIKDNPKLRPPIKQKRALNYGFDKTTPKPIWNEETRRINRMLLLGMKMDDVAIVLNKSKASIIQIKRRYMMPTKDTKN